MNTFDAYTTKEHRTEPPQGQELGEAVIVPPALPAVTAPFSRNTGFGAANFSKHNSTITLCIPPVRGPTYGAHPSNR